MTDERLHPVLRALILAVLAIASWALVILTVQRVWEALQ